jgi:hypothetical protein
MHTVAPTQAQLALLLSAARFTLLNVFGLLQHMQVYCLCKAEVHYNQPKTSVRRVREVRAIRADRRETTTARLVPQRESQSPAASGKRPPELREGTAPAKWPHAADSRMGSLPRATLERYFAG